MKAVLRLLNQNSAHIQSLEMWNQQMPLTENKQSMEETMHRSAHVLFHWNCVEGKMVKAIKIRRMATLHVLVHSVCLTMKLMMTEMAMTNAPNARLRIHVHDQIHARIHHRIQDRVHALHQFKKFDKKAGATTTTIVRRGLDPIRTQGLAPVHARIAPADHDHDPIHARIRIVPDDHALTLPVRIQDRVRVLIPRRAIPDQ